MIGYRAEPTGREDDWAFQVVRLSDGVCVGWFQTAERAQAAADNGGLPPAPRVEERPVAKHDDQLDMFGAHA